jgi:hypothetical protein
VTGYQTRKALYRHETAIQQSNSVRMTNAVTLHSTIYLFISNGAMSLFLHYHMLFATVKSLNDDNDAVPTALPVLLSWKI